VPPFFTLFVPFILVFLVWSIVRSVTGHQRYMRILQLKAEAHQRMVDRAGSDPALLELLKADGARVFDIPYVEPRMAPAPYQRVVTAVQIGLVLMSAGVALLLDRQYMHSPGTQEGMLVFGTLAVALGIGALLSAVAAYVAARMWHDHADDGRDRG